MKESNQTISQDFEYKFIAFIGKIGVVISLFLFPPIFKPLFAVSAFVLSETLELWWFSSLLLLVSLALIFLAKKIKTGYAFLLFVFFLLISFELITRVYVSASYTDQAKEKLGKLANKTYNDFAIYKAHPFVAYTGNPSVNYTEGDQQEKTTPFNNFGFNGPDFHYKKPPNTLRVACLGGSTTERGYPAVTAYQLQHYFGDSIRVEVQNFGVSGWTSANSVVNFILNVRSYHPDYVLIHHGWNESRVRNTPDSLFRTDYTHALTPFQEPKIIDKLPLRTSVLYRILKTKFSNTPDWMFLGEATVDKNRVQTEQNYNNIEELNPFKRNIKTIVDLCLIDSCKVILSTQPYSLTKNDNTSKTIFQANEIMRTIASNYKDQLLFLDLDSTTTGSLNSVFIDLGHMNELGKFYKGKEFARVIYNDITKDSLLPTYPYKLGKTSFRSYVKNATSVQANENTLRTKAKAQNLSLHALLKKESMANFNSNETLNSRFNLAYQEYRIRSNSDWMKTITTQAKEKKITIDAAVAAEVSKLTK